MHLTNNPQIPQIKVLGSGAFGKATLCLRKGDDEPFVVKRLHTNNLPEKEREAFEKEVKLLKELSEQEHPNIIRYYEHFKSSEV